MATFFWNQLKIVSWFVVKFIRLSLCVCVCVCVCVLSSGLNQLTRLHKTGVKIKKKSVRVTETTVLRFSYRTFGDIQFWLFLGEIKFFKNSLKKLMLSSQLVLLDLALIYTYSVKFLLRTDVSLKIWKIFYRSVEKNFLFKKKNFTNARYK